MRNIVRLARLLCRAWVGMPFHLGPLYLSFFLLASLVMTETFCSSLMVNLPIRKDGVRMASLLYVLSLFSLLSDEDQEEILNEVISSQSEQECASAQTG